MRRADARVRWEALSEGEQAFLLGLYRAEDPFGVNRAARPPFGPYPPFRQPMPTDGHSELEAASQRCQSSGHPQRFRG